MTINPAILTHDEWRGLFDSLFPENRDVYFTLGYHELNSVGADELPRCYRLGGESGTLYLPGMVMAIPGNGVWAALGGALRDFQTCNGYGGPFATGHIDATLLEEAWRRWRQEARNQGIVAAFFRLHPLLKNETLLPNSAIVRKDRSTVYVDLSDGVKAAWRRADSRHRNMVNKGRRCGHEVRWGCEGAWDEFQSVYSKAMERLNAPASLRFSEDYFSSLRLLPEAELATIHAKGKLMAGAVFLFSSRWGYYHLSAKEVDAENCMMNQLLQAAFERAYERGIQGVHLGGGRSAGENDSLLRFKKSTGGILVDFKVALLITDDAKYTELCNEWKLIHQINPTWLLPYREPVTATI